MPKSPPPLKTPFSNRRVREFLYLSEVDAVIAATQKTRASIRNQALVLLLFCQTLQPIELCWLRWQDINFAEKFLVVARNRRQPTRYQPQVAVNLQLLCPPEIDILQQLKEQRTTDWVFASERGVCLRATAAPQRALAASPDPTDWGKSRSAFSHPSLYAAAYWFVLPLCAVIAKSGAIPTPMLSALELA